MNTKLLFSKKSLRLWAIFFLIMLSLVGFEEVVDDVFYDPTEGDIESKIFDSEIKNYFNQFRSPVLNQIMTDITALGSISILLTISLIAGFVLWSYKKYFGLVYLSIVSSGSGIFVHYLKLFFERPRPDQPEKLSHVVGYSFPSGHTFAATSIYIALAYYTGLETNSLLKEVSLLSLATILIFLVATSRVFLGVHYPTDILAGVSGGAAWALSVTFIYESIRLHRS